VPCYRYCVKSSADNKLLRAYGDRAGDGMVHFSFVLELPPGERAREAAKRFVELHGVVEPVVATMEPCAAGFSFFVVYGRSTHAVDAAALDIPPARKESLSHDEVDHQIKTRLGRKIVVVGACTGSDAHTVGIDAILNFKGYAGDKGLESYKGFEVHNLGAQVENEQLAARAMALRADAILVSQVITQRNCHKENGRALVQLLEQKGSRGDLVLLLGGPRVDETLALELGFDAGFGPGTKPSDVASYLVERICAGSVEDTKRHTTAPTA
jgi:beta-lysine 5,6-aminomutase beta subunit